MLRNNKSLSDFKLFPITPFGLPYDGIMAEINQLLEAKEKQIFEGNKFKNFPHKNIYYVDDRLLDNPLTQEKIENPEKIIIELALAGYTKDDLEIEQFRDTITIKTKEKENKEEVEVSNNKYLKSKGISKKQFTETFKVYEIPKNIEVSFKDGILTLIITFEKSEEKVKKIDII